MCNSTPEVLEVQFYTCSKLKIVVKACSKCTKKSGSAILHMKRNPTPVVGAILHLLCGLLCVKVVWEGSKDDAREEEEA